jgi:hypothetical protein
MNIYMPPLRRVKRLKFNEKRDECHLSRTRPVSRRRRASKLDIFSIAAFLAARSLRFPLFEECHAYACARPKSARGSQLLPAGICIKTITPPYVCSEFKVGLHGKQLDFPPDVHSPFMLKNSDCLNSLC